MTGLVISQGAFKQTPRQKFIQDAIFSKTDQCIIWPFDIMPSGYCSFYINGKKEYCHRYVLAAVKGPPPNKKSEAAHDPCDCKFTFCINPRHLDWKTCLENKRDVIISGNSQRGERNYGAKLNRHQVKIIRADPRKQKIIAKDYGVTAETIGRIKRRVKWAWLD